MPDSEEDAVRRAIGTISQSDPLIKLLEQVRLRRMTPTDAGLRAVTESWLGTYQQVLKSGSFGKAALMRLDPSPRLAVLREEGVLPTDHIGLRALNSLFDSLLASAEH
ncbi:MAG: hypothetical protein ABW047_14640 [Nitrospiraceae bacterium]|jgi:hypothetical protein